MSVFVATLVGATSAAGAPGLPRSYDPTIIDSPNPIGGGSFGWGVTAGDVTGDGELDLLVAQAQTGRGQIFIFDGVTGQLVDTINPPEANPDGSPEVLGFVYVETMPDVGSCPGGDGPDADKICDLPTIAPGDGIPEIIVAARNLRVNTANGAAPPVAPNPNANPPVAGDPNVGRGYVFDGATRAVLKRIDMPQAERQIGQGGAQFGRMMMNPSGLPPCEGLRAENNNFGVGPCPERPLGERIGDVDGRGQPDIVITARSYRQPRGTAHPDSPCAAQTSVPVCANAGKAWVYAGEAIVGSDPNTILETAVQDLPNPRATASTGGEYGGNVWRVGDVTGDGFPEFVIPARNLSYPLNNPDTAGQANIGASFFWSGRQRLVQGSYQPCSGTNCLLRINPHPEPQPRSQFPNNFNSGRPTGDLGATETPDYLQPSPLQNVRSSDDGRVYVFNGDLAAGGGAEQSFNFATLDDPTPRQGGTFGGSTTGVGDLISGARGPANEILVGEFRFDTFTQNSTNTPGDLHFMNATTEQNLQTVPHPTGEGGDGFGIGLVPMGDLNDDGFLDFGVSAYLANVQVGGQGRAYIFKSNNAPVPSAPTQPAGNTIRPTTLVAGRCANDTIGTEGGDRLSGTLAGDRIFGFGGADRIEGFQSADCLDGGTGDDVLGGDDGQDRALGRNGDDRLNGDEGPDRLFGGKGRDRLRGGFGRDVLAGGDGNDRLIGGADEDRLFGEDGNDVLAAGDDRNRIDAGTGNDLVNARNGERDVVNCGRGRDRAKADRGDRVFGCERVARRSPRRRSG